MNNPTKEKRGNICLICNKKFLYRDVNIIKLFIQLKAMHEYAIKLELKEGVTQTQQEDLDYQEERYNKLMKDHTDLKEIKMNQLSEMHLKKDDIFYEEDWIQSDIEKLRKEKDYLQGKVTLIQNEHADKQKKLEQLYDDIKK